MSTQDVLLPYPVGALIEVHTAGPVDGEPDVRLAIVETVDDDSLDARIIAEWHSYDERRPLDFDARGITWTLYGKEITEEGVEVRVVQPDAVAALL